MVIYTGSMPAFRNRKPSVANVHAKERYLLVSLCSAYDGQYNYVLQFNSFPGYSPILETPILMTLRVWDRYSKPSKTL